MLKANCTLQEKDKQISVIYCGDFNSVPECGIYKLFTTGHVPDNFVDWSSSTYTNFLIQKFHTYILKSSVKSEVQNLNFCFDYFRYRRSSYWIESNQQQTFDKCLRYTQVY